MPTWPTYYWALDFAAQRSQVQLPAVPLSGHNLSKNCSRASVTKQYRYMYVQSKAVMSYGWEGNRRSLRYSRKWHYGAQNGVNAITAINCTSPLRKMATTQSYFNDQGKIGKNTEPRVCCYLIPFGLHCASCPPARQETANFAHFWICQISPCANFSEGYGPHLIQDSFGPHALPQTVSVSVQPFCTTRPCALQINTPTTPLSL